METITLVKFAIDGRQTCLFPTQNGPSVDEIVSLLNFYQRATGSFPVRPTICIFYNQEVIQKIT